MATVRKTTAMISRKKKAVPAEPKKPRKKKLRLTQIERRMLQFPPTETTWICSECTQINSGRVKTCWKCCEEKAKNAKRVWPTYIELCAKVNVAPGVLWKYDDSRRAYFTKAGREKWKEIEMDVNI